MDKSDPISDWHPADVKAALAKRGYTFARIAREHGYRDNSPSAVLRRPWAPVEKIVARIIGVKPEVIWPTRYTAGRVVRGPQTRRPKSKSRI